MPSTLAIARSYLDAGLSIIPIARDGSKAPDVRLLPRVQDEKRADRVKSTWSPFQQQPASLDQVKVWFGGKSPAGIGIVGGAVSGGLFIVDIDRGDLVEPFWELVNELRGPGLRKLPQVRSPREGGGLHIYCRSTAAVPTMKMATAPNLGDKRKTVTWIEVKGEGGYVVAPGSPADCHESGREYVHVAGAPLTEVPVLKALDVDALLTAARSFDQPGDISPPSENRFTRGGGHLTPLDDFDQRGPDWISPELLGGLGWKIVREDGGVLFWRQPGKANKGWSANTGYRDGKSCAGGLRVFSGNCHPFEPGSYGKARAWAIIHHKGDLKEATKALGLQGYGEKLNGRHASSANGTPAKASAEPAATPEPEPWDDPVPIDSGVKVQPFPVEVLPRLLAELVQSVASATNSPADYVGGLRPSASPPASRGRPATSTSRTNTRSFRVYTSASWPRRDRARRRR